MNSIAPVNERPINMQNDGQDGVDAVDDEAADKVNLCGKTGMVKWDLNPIN